MMKRIALYLALAVVAVSSQAQLLWKVSGNGLNKDSYILGTRHNVPSKMMDLIPGMEMALENCDIVVGELDYNFEESKSNLNMYAPSDSTLDKLYSPEELSTVKKSITKCLGPNCDFSQIMGLKPLAIYVTIQYGILNNNASSLDDYIDKGVMKRAKEMGHPSMGLDNNDYQDSLVNNLLNMPLTEQAEILFHYLKDSADEMIRSSLIQYGLYMSQRLDLYEMVNGDNEGDINNLLEADIRTQKWVNTLMLLMLKKSCLVCVGIGHLPGEHGLLQLLRKRGYTVEPMK